MQTTQNKPIQITEKILLSYSMQSGDEKPIVLTVSIDAAEFHSLGHKHAGRAIKKAANDIRAQIIKQLPVAAPDNIIGEPAEEEEVRS